MLTVEEQEFPPCPEDEGNFIKYACGFMGMGFLMPWQMIICSIDYFNALFPESGVAFYFAVTYCGFTALAFVPIIKFGVYLGSLPFRILISFLLFSCCMIVLCLLNHFKTYQFLQLLMIIPIIGLVESLAQSSVLTFVSCLPPNYFVYLQTGIGVSGIVAAILRVLTKIGLATELSTSAYIYFLVGFFITFSCFILSQVVINNKFAKHFTKKSFKISLTASTQKRTMTMGYLWKLLKNIYKPVFCVFFCFVVTWSTYPGMVSLLGSNIFSDSGWYTLLLIGTYNLMDFVGKAIPGISVLQKVKPNVVYILVLLRVLFYPLFVLSIHPPVFSYAPIHIILCALLGFSNGYLSTLLFLFVINEDVLHVPAHQKEDSITLMTAFLVFGLAGGSLLGLVFLPLLEY